MMQIRFGTDGWRAKIGDEFSFRNVRLFAEGYSNYLKKKQKSKECKVIVNFDPGFLSRKFAFETAKIFSLNGIKTYIPNRDIPLAAISLAIVQNKFDGGINFTISSINPIFNVLRIFSFKGTPALPSETSLIEREIEKISETFHFKPQYTNDELINNIDVKAAYVDYIEKIIDFDLIKKSGIKIVVDNLFGTSREYLDFILSENDIDIVSIHNFPYSSFGGISSPIDNNSLKDLLRVVVEKKANIGLATDISGDRFGIVDSKGRYLNSNIIMPPLTEYLITVRKMQGGIIKSVSTTNNIKRVADYYLRKVYVTPVGFKYLADMLSLKKGFIAIESTNGASLNYVVNIKDGILFNLLVTEMLAYYNLEMDKIMNNFYLKFPRLYSQEIAIRKNELIENKYKKILSQKKFYFKNFKLRRIEHIDGIKFIFGESWLLIRESGTSNVIRIYAESTILKETKLLLKLGRSLID